MIRTKSIVHDHHQTQFFNAFARRIVMLNLEKHATNWTDHKKKKKKKGANVR